MSLGLFLILTINKMYLNMLSLSLYIQNRPIHLLISLTDFAILRIILPNLYAMQECNAILVGEMYIFSKLNPDMLLKTLHHT